MSEQTNKRPDPQESNGKIILPAETDGKIAAMESGVTPANVENEAAVEDAHGHTVVARPAGKEDWIELHEDLPKPTYWPISMSVAITLIAFGIVNTLLITAAGIILLIISLIGWIGDVRDEARLRSH